jgi:hypothetical protein
VVPPGSWRRVAGGGDGRPDLTGLI